MLILKRPSTRQPQTVVGVDWANPLARELVGAWLPLFGDSLYDASRRIGTLTAVGSPVKTISTDGIQNALNGSSQYFTNTVQTLATQLPLTFSIIVVANQWDVIQRVFDISTGTTANDVIGLRMDFSDSGRWCAQHYDGSTDSNAASIRTSAEIGARRHLHGVFESLSSRKLYIDGVLINTSTTAAVAPSGINRVTIGFAPWSSSEYFNGRVIAPKLWARALTAEEVRTDYLNPWGVFAPRRIYIPTAAAAASAPTITALSAISITATSAQPRISYS